MRFAARDRARKAGRRFVAMVAIAGVVGAAVFVAPRVGASDDPNADRSNLPHLTHRLRTWGNHDLFLEAVEAASLADAIGAAPMLTLFAPTDAAMEQFLADFGVASPSDLGQDILRPFVLHHLVSGHRSSGALAERAAAGDPSWRTVLGNRLVSDGVTVNGVPIVGTDIPARNGVMHEIDGYLLPVPDGQGGYLDADPSLLEGGGGTTTTTEQAVTTTTEQSTTTTEQSTTTTTEQSTTTTTEQPTTTTTEPTTTTTTAPDLPPVDATTDLVQYTEAVTVDIEAFWAEQLPGVYGIAYEPVAAVIPYDSANPSSCAGQPNPLLNAIYCGPEDTISYDAEFLMPRLANAYGNVGATVVLAHEWGHAIQARGGSPLDEIDLELQADCYAGAYLGAARDGERDGVIVVDLELENASFALFELRDSESSGSVYSLHGTGFDRVAALVDGIDGGPSACASYDATGAHNVDLPLPEGDAEKSLDEIVAASQVSLDDYWSATLDSLELVGLALEAAGTAAASCPDSLEPTLDFCAPTATVVYEVGYLDFVTRATFDSAVFGSNVVLESGDFAAATLLAREYAFGLLTLLGYDPADPVVNGAADCMAGAWAFYVATGNSPLLSLSYSDLDEGLLSFVLDGPAPGGTTFDRFVQYQSGFFDGIDSCIAALP